MKFVFRLQKELLFINTTISAWLNAVLYLSIDKDCIDINYRVLINLNSKFSKK